jgi:hypothetical protein
LNQPLLPEDEPHSEADVRLLVRTKHACTGIVDPNIDAAESRLGLFGQELYSIRSHRLAQRERRRRALRIHLPSFAERIRDVMPGRT